MDTKHDGHNQAGNVQNGRQRRLWRRVIPLGIAMTMAMAISTGWAVEDRNPGDRPPHGPGRMAEGPGMPHPPKPPPHIPMVLHLGLTDAQQQQIVALHEEEKRAVEGAMGSLKGQRDKLQKIIRAESLDEKALRTVLAEGNAARNEMQFHHIRSLNKLWNILTPAQRELATLTGAAPHGWGGGLPPEALLLEGGR